MKKRLLLCVLALAATLLAACNTTRPDADTPSDGPTIMTIGPAITEIVVGLGAADRIIAADTFSAMVPGVPAGIPTVDMWNLDIEAVLMANADMILATSMINWGDDPLAVAAETGTQVVYLPGFSASIAEIEDSIRFIAETLGTPAAADGVIDAMQAEIAAVRAIGATIANRRTVYFEMEPPPMMFSFGGGTFINEMLEIIGAVNIFADYTAFVPVSDEQVIVANPDVILSNFPWHDDPIGEIMSRTGWDGIAAVESGRVHIIDTDASSRDSQNIVTALWEMARAVYPEYFN
jgi:iron complex transport system substrate-binding protein